MSNVKPSKKLLWSKNEVVGLGFILLMGDSHWVYGFYFAAFGWAQSRGFFVGQSGCLSSLEIQESRVYTCLIVSLRCIHGYMKMYLHVGATGFGVLQALFSN